MRLPAGFQGHVGSCGVFPQICGGECLVSVFPPLGVGLFGASEWRTSLLVVSARAAVRHRGSRGS